MRGAEHADRQDAAVKFALWHPMPWPGYPADRKAWPYDNQFCDPEVAAGLLDEYLAEVAFADALGFDWIMIGEEHQTPYGLVPNAAAMGCAVARATRRAKVAVVGCPTGFLNPVRVAEEYALVDVLSRGRLIAGFIQGTSQTALTYNVGMDDIWSRYVEATELVLRSFQADRPFTHAGDCYQFGPISIWPRPFQSRPLMVMPATSVRAAQFAAKHRAIAAIARLKAVDALTKWSACTKAYASAAMEARWQPSADNYLVATHACVAPTTDEAEQLLAFGETYVYGALSGAVSAGTATRAAPAAREPSTADRLEAGTVIAASPDDLARQVSSLRDAAGIGVLALNFKVGRIPHHAVMRSIKMFADSMFPKAADPVACGVMSSGDN
ncbi:MAG TPA: LLM class flavin-dependent oxidoreductase [Streptosporangiaceae bacterium]|nr:LLM class flavin-dependent oxidoreductase [Streptosporangiaceae bacterium]